MIIGNWIKISNQPTYLVWFLPRREGWYNNLSIVVKTEEGKWITFLSAGTFESSKVLYRGNNKQKALKIAIDYMKSNSNG